MFGLLIRSILGQGDRAQYRQNLSLSDAKILEIFADLSLTVGECGDYQDT